MDPAKRAFETVSDFDWDVFGKPASARCSITAEDMAAVFENGNRTLTKTEAVKALIEQTGCEKSAAYGALKLEGRFQSQLRSERGKLKWVA